MRINMKFAFKNWWKEFKLRKTVHYKGKKRSETNVIFEPFGFNFASYPFPLSRINLPEKDGSEQLKMSSMEKDRRDLIEQLNRGEGFTKQLVIVLLNFELTIYF